ncbi:hypothetical protein WH91_04275 [Devosia psychrophila]|uniref:LysR substrate binding domain-containing protein n=1 Tax=Devosia psychrophila TaxID=728005 RepID=A0ABR5E1I3_9HYPH|nr:hypothetical protein WH91_04275 [Devosia psychrophila]
MTRAGAYVREAQLFEKRADMALVILHPKPLLDHTLKIDPAPPNDTINLRIWTGLDDGDEFGLLLLRKSRPRADCPVLEQTIRTSLVEPMHPVPERLPVHAANQGGVGAVHAVKNRRQ